MVAVGRGVDDDLHAFVRVRVRHLAGAVAVLRAKVDGRRCGEPAGGERIEFGAIIG